MGVNQVCPVVFRGGKVVESRGDRQDVFGEADRGDGSGYHRHDIDHGQFPSGQGQAPVEQAQQRIEEKDEDEEDKEGDRSTEVVR